MPRRRIERNLHDGAQQRLVSLAPNLRAAQAAAPLGTGDLVHRDRVTTPGDSWAVEAVAGPADALELSGSYEHVTFVYPDPDDLSVTVDIGGLVVGATHGHVIGSPDKMGQWLAGQALGRQCAREADILFSGHFHTYRHQDLGGGRSWFMAPAVDNGSPCFRNRKDVDSRSGMISVELTPGIPPERHGLVLHAGVPSLARVTYLHQLSAPVYRH